MESGGYVCGGYKITILNHTKKGEFKYNICNIHTGDIFKTNDVYEFARRIEKILND